MISVKKDFETIPERLNSERCIEKIAQTLVEKNAHNFSTYYYRDGCLEVLKTLYHNKCAFCETRTSAGAVLRVDHYRPKALLTGDLVHLGYYWLAYEWSNLILICEICNRNKFNFFPIAINGIRVYKPIIDDNGKCIFASNHIKTTHFIEENPLLLNPEIDEVETHFIINSKGEWKPLSEKGSITESVCKLNRGDLVYMRLSKIEKLVSKLKRELDLFIVHQEINESNFKINLRNLFDDLVYKTDPSMPYSRTYWFMFNKFDKVVLPHFEGEKSKAIILDAFLAYKDRKL
jgi:hypothetical protein